MFKILRSGFSDFVCQCGRQITKDGKYIGRSLKLDEKSQIGDFTITGQCNNCDFVHTINTDESGNIVAILTSQSII